MQNTCQYKAPFGDLYLTSQDDYLTRVSFTKTDITGTSSILKETSKQFDKYFKGELQQFDIPIKFNYGTDFQQSVWRALSTIAYGDAVSYKHIAEQINNPKAVRAVGGANNKNPISIIIPCHRVIGMNGKLVGFGGGLDKKQWLLTHEQDNKS